MNSPSRPVFLLLLVLSMFCLGDTASPLPAAGQSIAELEPLADPLDTPLWHWLSPRPTDNRLQDVTFTCDSIAVAVGDRVIAMTENGGYSWRSVETPSAELMAVSFVDASTGTAVGFGGSILRTTDGGRSWINQPSGTTVNFSDVHMIARGVVVVTGLDGSIFRTADGGATWTRPHTGSNGLRGLDFIDENTGMAVGAGGTVLRTYDGGSTWAAKQLPTGVTMLDVDMVDNRHATAVGGNGSIFTTTDGGENWAGICCDVTRHYETVHFFDTQTGIVTGLVGEFNSTGLLLTTSDGGSTWSESTGWPKIHGIAFADRNTAIGCASVGYVYLTNCIGTSWHDRRQVAVPPTYLNDVHFVDNLTGTIIGNGGAVYHTTDGGWSWTGCATGVTDDLLDIEFADADNGWIAGGTTLLRTRDGGASWAGSDVGVEASAVSFPDPTTGYVASVTDGVVLRTQNGGDSWMPVLDDLEPRDVCFPVPDTGYVAESGGLLMTRDGGGSWVSADITPPYGLDALWFFDATHGIAVGGGGAVYQTADGIGWLRRFSGSIDRLTDVAFFSPLDGFVTGEGHPLQTTDGGISWRRFFSPMYRYPTAVGPGGGIVGESGQVLSVTAPPGAPPPGPPLPPPSEVFLYPPSPGLSSVGLEWDIQSSGPFADVAGYRLVRRCDGTDPVWIPDDGLLAASETSYRDIGLQPGTRYEYQLVAHLEQGCEMSTDARETVTGQLNPALSGTALAEGARLNWLIQSHPDIVGFRLMREDAAGGTVAIPEADLFPPDTRSYIDRGLTVGAAYSYKLVVVLVPDVELESSAAEVVPLSIPVITDLRATASTHKVQLEWEIDQNEAAAISGFRFIRRQGNVQITVPAEWTLGPSTRSYTDRGVEPGTSYNYSLVVYLAIDGTSVSDPLTVNTLPVPVVESFTAAPSENRIALSWNLDSVDLVLGFQIRRESDTGVPVWMPPDTLLDRDSRRYTDTDVVAGERYVYSLFIPLTTGAQVWSDPLEVVAEVPVTEYVLGQNHPNPFNPGTSIPYSLLEESRVLLEVFDTAGRRVRTIVDQIQGRGHKTASWDGLNPDGSPAPSGVYFYRLRAGGFTASRKMILLR